LAAPLSPSSLPEHQNAGAVVVVVDPGPAAGAGA
jgi:hypothetical protein